jgi:two-component system chemotaxis response regulator CheY
MRFLIVDDSKTMRLIVRRSLRQAGYDNVTVDEAPDGSDAVDMVAKQTYDLVLSDWNMSKMSGPDMLKTFNDLGRKIRVGFITSEGSEAMVKKVMDLGAIFLLAKPFTPEALKFEIDKALKKKST